MRRAERPTKVCPACGRTFAWRKRWERTWPNVLYCSDACRSRRGLEGGAELEAGILTLLARRARGATMCPSEVLSAEEKQQPERMEAVRAAARRLVRRGVIDIVQRGVVVDPDRARGPIRLRLRGNCDADAERVQPIAQKPS